MAAFRIIVLHLLTLGSCERENRLDDIQTLSDISKVDVDVLSMIRKVVDHVYSHSLLSRPDPDNPEYQSDESTDCVFNLFDATDQLNELMPVVARRLKLRFSKKNDKILFKAIESAVYILCSPLHPDPTLDAIDGFREWVIMEDEGRRSAIESAVTIKMHWAFNVERGQNLMEKCLNKLNAKNTRKIYRKLRRQYPKQRFMMEMIDGIFTMHCVRTYSTNQEVQEFIDILLGMEGTERFNKLLAGQMKPHLTESVDFEECKEGSAVLIDQLERSILNEHSEFRQYPVQNAVTTLIERECTQRFVDEVSDLNSVHPTDSVHSDL